MLETINTYTTATEAYIAKGRLEAEGISAYISDEHQITANWSMSLALGGVRLQVHNSVADEARKIISELALGSYEDLVSDEEMITCLKCQSKDVQEVHWKWKLAFVSFILYFLPLPFSRYQYKCNSCSFTWTDKK